MRIIQSKESWWAIGTTGVARIPPELVPKDTEVSQEIRNQLQDSDMMNGSKEDPYHLTVLTSTRCNLACHYCFQHENVPVEMEAPVRIPGAALTENVIDEIFTFAATQMARYDKHTIDLMLFGGEPLLAPKACLGVLNKASAIGLADADMITNGVLLTRTLSRDLSNAGLQKTQITLDGDQLSHDSIRHTRGKRGTYDRILENVANAVEETGLAVSLRVNVTAPVIARIDRLITDLVQRVPPHQIRVGFAMVHDPGIGFSGVVQRTDELASTIANAYFALAEVGFEVPLPRGTKPCLACGEHGGKTGAVINADGTLYSCWESAGKPGWNVGDIRTGYLDDSVIAPRWVVCGYSASPQEEGSTAFADLLDGLVLDGMYQRQLLDQVG